jgi:uncharacterized protein YfaT (DUF1175 family)
MEPCAPRRTPQWIACALTVVTLAIVGCSRDKLVVASTATSLQADGRTHIVAILSRRSDGPLSPASLESATPYLRFLAQSPTSVAISVRSPVLPGAADPHFSWRGHRYSLAIRYIPSDSDTFHDGLPDALHLHTPEDRQAFRNWFTAMVEQEADLPTDKLPAEIDDCAALLRNAYRESLAQHDERWFAAQPEPERFTSLSSVAQYHYPATPLGLNLFRVAPGPYSPADLNNGALAQFADAHALLYFNTYLVSRDLRAARPADLLFFRQLEQNSQYHSMVVTGPHADQVIYHTGPVGKQKGEIRRVEIQDLLHHPDARWRPIPANTNFLGVYRWNLLHDGD